MEKILRIFKENESFLLISHVSPDGDTLGSAAALALALKSADKKAVLACDGTVPEKLSFLCDYCEFKLIDEVNDIEFDCIAAIDVASSARLGVFEDKFQSHSNTVVIDHHPTNEGFGAFNLIKPYSSTSEIILEVIDGLDIPLTKEIADMLFVAVSTDTNNFVYSSVSADTLSMAARLRAAGADIPGICDKVYYRRSVEETRAIGLGISTLEIHEDGRISTSYMTKEMLQSIGAKREHCESIINYCREIKGVEVALFLNEMDGGKFKVSLRSNSYVDVGMLAQKHGGGGHARAAGMVMKGSADEVKMLAIAEVKEYLR